MAIRRSRWLCAVAVAATIALGLGSRTVALPKGIGDALYATMMFWGLALLAPRARASRLAAAALAWCVAVEGLQLDHAPWLEALRATTPGRLVLGQGFHAVDLVCYAIGVAVAVGSDALLRSARAHVDRAR
jgi:hypothetical protein